MASTRGLAPPDKAELGVVRHVVISERDQVGDWGEDKEARSGLRGEKKVRIHRGLK